MRVQLRQKKLANGRTSLYLDIYVDGRRYYEFLKLYLPKDRNERREILRLAEEIRAKKQLEIQAAEHGYVPKFKKESDFIQYFEQLASTRHKTWRSVLLKLKAFTKDEVPFNRIDSRWLDSFQKFVMKDVCDNSANVYLHKIKAALNIAVKDGLISENPCDRIDIVKTEPSQRTYLTFEELQKLASTPTKHEEIKKAFLFSCYTGLRLSDVKALTGSRIVSGQLQFKQKKTGGFEYLPISPMAQRLIPGHLAPNEPLFKLPKSEGGLWTHLQIWVTAAGITKHVSFHVARHTFATLALAHTKDLYMVSKLLGHKDIKHTQIYAKIMDDRKEEAMALLPRIQM